MVSESEGTHSGSTDDELARASRARGAAEESEACEETVVAGAVREDTRWRRSKRRRHPSTACRSSSGANGGLTNDTCTLRSPSSPLLTTSLCARLRLVRVSLVYLFIRRVFLIKIVDQNVLIFGVNFNCWDLIYNEMMYDQHFIFIL